MKKLFFAAFLLIAIVSMAVCAFATAPEFSDLAVTLSKEPESTDTNVIYNLSGKLDVTKKTGVTALVTDAATAADVAHISGEKIAYINNFATGADGTFTANLAVSKDYYAKIKENGAGYCVLLGTYEGSNAILYFAEEVKTATGYLALDESELVLEYPDLLYSEVASALPQKVLAVFSEDEKVQRPITWNTDAVLTAPGTYEAVGTVELSDGETAESTEITVSITICGTIKSIAIPTTKEITAATEAEAKTALGSSVSAIDSENFTKTLAIKDWTIAGFASPGTFTATPVIDGTAKTGYVLVTCDGKSYRVSDSLVKSISVTAKKVIPGDVDANGTVTRADLLRLAKHFSGWEVVIDEAASDVDASGTVTRADLLRLAKYFSGWEVKLGE